MKTLAELKAECAALGINVTENRDERAKSRTSMPCGIITGRETTPATRYHPRSTDAPG